MREHLPYEDLYIYLVKGQVPETYEAVLGDTFIGNWVEDDIAFLFFSKPSKDKVETIIKNHEYLAYIDEHHFTYEQWQGGILEPVKIGPFLIAPPWVEVARRLGDIKILLNPGVVFGTGLHPTTKDCLRALAILQGEQIPMRNVLDLGTGTGILALAAAFLGAEEVIAVELNSLAVKTAKNNVLLNGLQGIIKVIEGQAQAFVDQPADLVIANIHYKVIEDLFENEGFRKKPRFIISGLMRTQVRDLKKQIDEYGLEIIREWDHEMTWYTLLLAKT